MHGSSRSRTRVAVLGSRPAIGMLIALLGEHAHNLLNILVQPLYGLFNALQPPARTFPGAPASTTELLGDGR